jgi:hypothetical protein
VPGRRVPFVEGIVGDKVYRGPRIAAVVHICTWKMEIVHSSDRQDIGVPPKRRIIDRVIVRISRSRRLARDVRRHRRNAPAFIRIAMIRITLWRLAAKHSVGIRAS